MSTTILAVLVCLPGTWYNRVSLAIKLSILLLTLLLQFSHPLFCSATDTCLLSEAFFLPLFALFQCSAVLDVGERKLVVRHKDKKLWERRVLETRHEKMGEGGETLDI